MSKGVLYVGTDEKYVYEAIESAKSLSDENNIPASIITTDTLSKEMELDIFDNIITLSDPFNDVRDKQYNLNKSPYKKTLYLDGDTLVIDDISSIFELLDRVDLIASHAGSRHKVVTPNIPDCLPEFNTGVLAYNSNSQEVEEVLELWITLQKRQIKEGRPYQNETIPREGAKNLEEAGGPFGRLYGQTTFTEAVFQSDIKFSNFPPEYNFGKTGRTYARYRVKILHGSDRNKLYPIINNRIEPRYFIGRKIHYPKSDDKERIDSLSESIIIKIRSKVGKVSRKLNIYDELKLIERKIT